MTFQPIDVCQDEQLSVHVSDYSIPQATHTIMIRNIRSRDNYSKSFKIATTQNVDYLYTIIKKFMDSQYMQRKINSNLLFTTYAHTNANTHKICITPYGRLRTEIGRTLNISSPGLTSEELARDIYRFLCNGKTKF